jgi:hypothetical protein
MKFTEDFQRTVEVVSKIVTTAALVFGGFWTVNSYFAQRQADLQNRELETRKQFLQKRLEVCMDVTNAAATIAVNEDPKDVVAAKKKFWTYYWGSLRMVDDLGTRKSMVNFAACLSPDKCPSIQAAATELAYYCRLSLGGSWDQVPLPPPVAPSNLKAVVE